MSQFVLRIAMTGVNHLTHQFQNLARFRAQMLTAPNVWARYNARIRHSYAVQANNAFTYGNLARAGFNGVMSEYGEMFKDTLPYYRAAHSASPNVRQFGQAAGLGDFLGMGPGGTAQAANALRDRLSNDPLAMMAFGRPMLPDRIGGTQDNARLLVQALDQLRRATTDEAALLKARRLGMEDSLWVRKVSDGMYDALKSGGQRVADIRGRNEHVDAMSHAYEARKFQERDALTSAIGPYMSVAGQALGEAFWWALRGGPIWHGGGTPKESGKDAGGMNEKDLAYVFRDQERTIYGGEERLRAAIPGGLKGFRLQEALHSDAIQLGGIAR
jgi:hypothetical protein